jgi:L-serine deaminase
VRVLEPASRMIVGVVSQPSRLRISSASPGQSVTSLIQSRPGKSCSSRASIALFTVGCRRALGGVAAAGAAASLFALAGAAAAGSGALARRSLSLPATGAAPGLAAGLPAGRAGGSA